MRGGSSGAPGRPVLAARPYPRDGREAHWNAEQIALLLNLAASRLHQASPSNLAGQGCSPTTLGALVLEPAA